MSESDPRKLGSTERRFLITGITGTMGVELTRLILAESPNNRIVGISRDEQKQQAFPVKSNRVRLKLGNVSDTRSLYRAATNASWMGYEAIFHLAAAKCAPYLEANPHEAINSNIVGVQNVLDLATELGSRVCFTSSDKAVKPINLYGYTKGVGERLVLAPSELYEAHTVYRYGNVLGSRGSIMPSLIRSLINDRKAYITHQNMTRFWILAEDVAKFIWDNHGSEGVQIPEMRSARVLDLIQVTAALLGVSEYKIENIGIRAGEKIHEDITEDSNSGQAKNIMSREQLSTLVSRTLRSMGIFDLSTAAVSAAATMH